MHGETITFGGGAIHRDAHLRARAAKLLNHPDARILAFWRGRPLVDTASNRLVWLRPDKPLLQPAADRPVFLGMTGQSPRFAISIPDWAGIGAQPQAFFDDTAYPHPDLPGSHRFADLRSIMAALSPDDAGDAATAKSLLGWHENHRFCANCGTKTTPAMGGWQRDCPQCDRKHFPRVDPVVIMLVTHGQDVLLGRSPGWPDGMYSLLAGFVEPGETISEAVAREVFEETGVRIGPAHYLADQPWPFPSTLMIGCRAVASTRTITPDPVEIEDAKWVSRETLMEAMSGTNPALLPVRNGTIARLLLDKWLADRL